MGNWSYSGGFSGTGPSFGGTGSRAGSAAGADVEVTRGVIDKAMSPFRYGQGAARAGIAPMTGNSALSYSPPNFTPSYGSSLGSFAGSEIADSITPSTTPSTSSSMSSYADLLADQYAPAIAAAELEAQLARNKIGYSDSSYDIRERDLRSNYGFDAASLGIKSRGYDLDRQAIGLEMERAGIGRRQNESDRDYFDRMKQFATSLHGENVNSIQFDAAENSRGLKSQYTTAGTLFSKGHGDDQFANYARSASDLAKEQIGYDKTIAGLDRDILNTRYEDERIGLSERESQIARSKLDNLSAQLGIDRARLEATLASGLEQLGLDRTISLEELVAGASSAEGAKGKILLDLFMQLIEAGLPPGDTFSRFLPPSVPLYANEDSYSHGGGKVY